MWIVTFNGINEANYLVCSPTTSYAKHAVEHLCSHEDAGAETYLSSI